jgi:dethiobiotin synthetase
LEHASCKGLSVLGYVLNRVSNENSLAADTNREVLSSLTGVQCLGELPFSETAETRKQFPQDEFEKELAIRLIAPFLGR